MKQLVLLMVVVLGAVLAMPASAQSAAPPSAATGQLAEGEIRNIDRVAGTVTIKHGPIANLKMSAMTMVFRVSDPAMLAQVKPGDRIRFGAENPGGQLTVVKLEVAR